MTRTAAPDLGYGTTAGGTRALAGTVTVSSAALGHAPDDVDLRSGARPVESESGWRAADSGPAWLQVDLGRPFWITKIQQVFAANDVWSFTVSASIDGVNWIQLDDRSKGRAGVVFACAASGLYRFVRLSVLGSEQGHPPSSRAFTVTGTDGGHDIAHAATVRASSAAPDYPADAAVDGRSSTYWRSEADAGRHWLQVDLGREALVTLIRQDFVETGQHSFELSASLDGVSWSSLGQWTETHGHSFEVAVARERYRHVRLTVHDGSGTSAGLHVFGFADLAATDAWNEDGPFRVVDLGAAHRIEEVRPITGAAPPVEVSTDGTGWEPHRGAEQPLHRYVRVPHDTPVQVFGTPVVRDLAAGLRSVRSHGWTVVDLGNTSWVETVGAGDDTVPGPVEVSGDGVSWAPAGDALPGLHRWVRVRTEHGHPVVRGTGSPNGSRWYEASGSVFRYFPNNHPVTPLMTIIDELPERRRQGYTAIEVAPPFQGSGRHDAADYFAGLGATDNYAVDSRIGTMADWTRLIDTAHSLDMRVVMFGNLGYSDVTAPFFEKAVRDFAAGNDSEERGWFRLADRPDGDRWYRHAETGVWYYAYWGVHDPSYDWAGTWPREAARVMQHWLDTGVDGIGMDAPASYPGLTRELNNEVITNPMNERGAMSMPEGAAVSAEPDDMIEQGEFVRWARDWGYSTIQDLWIEHWVDPRFSRVVDAARRQDATTLAGAMATSRDALVSRGATTVTSASWPLDYDSETRLPLPERESIEVRLLEASTLTTMGTLNYLVNAADWMHPDESPEVLPSWPADQTDLLERVYRAQAAYPALHQVGARVELTTDSVAGLAYLRRDPTGDVTALVVLNFAADPRTVTVELAGSGVTTPQVPVDLLTGLSGLPIDSDAYRLTLPGRGFVELAVS